MWWMIVVAASVLGLLWGIYVVYLDIYNYQVLQRKLRKEREVDESG